ncbi:MAG TPA: 2,3-bisphosphoglycerate-dependent phosphoglycerate mutase [Thermopetrobacter sp.]|nr:2,3-bisphosphoglycerate-dependent phosphoglycerate mutase [Thermopetrobacter sp.]
MTRTLVLVRHGQSEWNEKNLFTGWADVGLTEQGIAEAHKAAHLLREKGMHFDEAFTSDLKRAQETLDIILADLGQTGIPVTRDKAINERDYGDLVGMNKDEARRRWGPEQVHIWRRSYDVRPPGGESLKDTAERALPYFREHILPRVLAGEDVLVSAHGNSLRAIIMWLEKLTPEQVLKLELATGVPIVYRFDEKGRIIGKDILGAEDHGGGWTTSIPGEGEGEADGDAG